MTRSTISLEPGNAIPVAVADYQASYVGTATVQLSGIDSGQLKLVWGPPRQTPTDPSDDMREMSYRVWRKSGTGAWTELTSEADRAASGRSPRPQQPGTYTYAVQAWDPVGQGSAYGEVAREALTVGSAPRGASSMHRVQARRRYDTDRERRDLRRRCGPAREPLHLAIPGQGL